MIAALLLGRPRSRPPAYVLGLSEMVALKTALAAGMLSAAADARSAAR